MYIVLEGVVGAGKTTQSKLLYAYLQEKYPDREVLLVREPGGTPIAEAIRKAVNGTNYGDEHMHPLTDVYLFVAARAQLLHTVVKPAIESGAIIISDRSFITSLAYQGHTQGIGIETVREANKLVVQDCLPDVILFFDIPVEIGYQRTFDSAGDKRESKSIEFFQTVHEGFETLFEFGPIKDRLLRVNANQEQEEVFKELMGKIKL